MELARVAFSVGLVRVDTDSAADTDAAAVEADAGLISVCIGTGEVRS